MVGGGGRSADQTHQSAARSRSLAGSARQKGGPSLADPSGDIHGQPETAGKESDRQETRRAFCRISVIFLSAPQQFTCF